jgi:hypothetical protein
MMADQHFSPIVPTIRNLGSSSIRAGISTRFNPTERIILAGDHTAWARIDAPTLKDRTYEHQVQPFSGAKPVTLGQGCGALYSH